MVILRYLYTLGDPSLRCPLSQSLDESQQESLPQRFLDRAEGVSYAWGDPLHKCLLLLEGILKSSIGGLRVLAGYPR